MMPKLMLCLTVFFLAAAVRAEPTDAATAAEVAAYRAEIVAALRAQLTAKGVPARTRLIESPAGDDRVAIGADKLTVITATIGADGVATACHQGIEAAAHTVAAARGDQHE